MGKIIKITSILSVILKLVFIICGVMADLLMTALNNQGTIEIAGIVSAIAAFVVIELVDLVVKLIMMILLINSSASDGDNYAIELIIMIVGSCGLLSLVFTIINIGIQYFISSYFGISFLASYSSAATGANFVMFLNTISSGLIVISSTIAFCKKKWVNTLKVLINGEVDI